MRSSTTPPPPSTRSASPPSDLPPVAKLDISGSFNRAKFDGWIAKTAVATRKTVGEVLREQSGLLARDTISLTPPFAGSPDLKSAFASDRKVGRAAVARDIRQVYASTATLYSYAASSGAEDPEAAAKAAVKFAKKGDTTSLHALLKRLNVTHFTEAATAAPEPDPAIHKSARDRRGRVRWVKPRQIVTSSAALNRYIKTKSDLVGRHKKGWSPQDTRFQPKGLPLWVSSQATRAGLLNKTDSKADPFFRLSNTEPGIGGQNATLSIARLALANRERKMQNALRAKMRGAWKR